MPKLEPLIRLRHIAVCYKSRSIFRSKAQYWALKDVSFDLYRGETLGVVGRNGAGKSTLLRLVAGIIDPDRGEILRQPARAALLSLQAGFLPHLSGRENAILGGILLGFQHSEIIAKLDAIIAFAELEQSIDDPLATYSQGMRARLGFALAMQVDPDILLIDEVLAVGDMDFRKKSGHELRKRIKSNQTVMLVSHDTSTLRDHCDRIVWIEKGQKVAEGDANEVLERYLKGPP